MWRRAEVMVGLGGGCGRLALVMKTSAFHHQLFVVFIPSQLNHI
jgi:hypothetical protein